MTTLNLKTTVEKTAKTANESFEVTSGRGWRLVVEAYVSKKHGAGTKCKHVGDGIYFTGLSANSMAALISAYGSDMEDITALVESVHLMKQVNIQLGGWEANPDKGIKASPPVTTLAAARAKFE